MQSTKSHPVSAACCALFSLLLGGALLPAMAASASPASHAPSARVTGGSIAGTSTNGVDAFLGIPYAAAPVGSLRWRAPQAVVPWSGVRTARAFGNDCMQDKASNPLTPGYVNGMSEDCLYLNAWHPHGATRPLPVMVWIHGGAFIMGSGSLPDYDGTALARKGVLLVTLNYRLGRFGTYAHPTLSAEQGDAGPVANYGLMDQIAALRWVRANAAALGGDPENVTVFGESAGATSINFLMTSPLARGLFDKAITESGGAGNAIQALRGGPASAEAAGLAWARGKGVADGDVAALRALPAATVLDAPVRTVAAPVLDGKLIVRDTATAFRLGEAAAIPYLTGANDYEQSLMRWLPGAGDAMLAKLGGAGEPILAEYLQPDVARGDAVGRMWGEMAMVEPARRRARQLAARGVPVWLYRYSYVPQALRATVPGAGHDNEIEMVFATPSHRSRAGWTAQDQAMAERVSDYWVAFARTGSPVVAAAPAWPRFDAEGDRLMEFSKAGAQVVGGFGKVRLDMLEAAADAGRAP
ncbi:para-nitrobenzyl esterase [Pseudoduganella lurida]|uniref:Para-nitrobenzyl esterase n=1 Tax=Pseudoduganella lurida TaxID=1036180 RepID=A0A562RC06_9BURK|nr:carboxylesterase family protein [Pseudoduganella lurida]TWI66568.1 para-nitrobenzyl esterase [Pseudoduganella lurida]